MSGDTYQPPISQDLATRPVSEFMTEKVVTASPGTTLKTAMQLLITNNVSGLPIVDANGRCVGVYSELDAVLQGGSGPLTETIRFSSKLISVLDTAHFKDALVLIAKNKVKRLPVVDARGMLVGVISRSDLLKALFEDLSPA